MTAKKPAPEPAPFDLDAWIDAVERPEVTVLLYPLDLEHAAKVAAIEAQIPEAEKVGPENRGMDDASPEALLAQLAELRAERAASALKVRIRQMTEAELRPVTLAAIEAGVTDNQTLGYHRIAAALIEPKFTPEQLARLHKRDRSGEHMVNQLAEAFVALTEDLSVPS